MGRKTSGPIFWLAELPNQMNKLIKGKNLFLCYISSFLLLLSCCFPALSAQLPDPKDDYDSLIVQPKERILKANRMSRLMYRYGVSRFQKIDNDLYVVPLNTNVDKDLKITELQQSGYFNYVEPNYKLYTDQKAPERDYIKVIKMPDDEPAPILSTKEVTPNDKGFSSQYYLKEINATKAWRTTVGNSQVVVAVLDTGIDANHPDLSGKISGSISDDLSDSIGHGTEVAGIIAANTNNNQGIAGVTWKTKILSLRITDDIGQARVSTVASALDEAYNSGAKIVQISLSTNQYSKTLQNAIKQAQSRGLIIVSTAGNTGVQELRYPGAFTGVIAVGSVDKNKELESYSTTGEHVSFVAPGTSIYTTTTNSSYGSVSGTSFSAPQIAGAAALVWSVAPDLTNDEVRDILIRSAEDLGDPGKDIKYGYGLLNTQKAVELAKAKLTEVQE